MSVAAATCCCTRLTSLRGSLPSTLELERWAACSRKLSELNVGLPGQFRLDTTQRTPPFFQTLLMPSTHQILGLRFFDGDVDEAIALMSNHGGFLVAPSGTCFARLRRDAAYREAMTQADVVIPDSGAMVLLWRALNGGKIKRISGLKYLQCLAAQLFADKASTVFWVLPN